jgi:hypothetical protein
LNELLSQRRPRLDDVYYAAGRVLHYIQDMSVPSHVAPIYHVKFSILGLTFGAPDEFDGYSPRTAPPFEILTQDDCKQISKDIRTPLDILSATVSDTLAAIGQSVEVDAQPLPGATIWRRYWGDPATAADPERRGFSVYGACRFARDGGPPWCADGPSLDKFFWDRYRRVVLDTAKLLRYVERSLLSSRRD